MSKRTYEIDGRDFSSLEEFYEVISRVLIPGANWGHNLNAFNDILRGGFGTPEGGFVLLWKNSDLSRQRLGYPETERQLERILRGCHPLNRDTVMADIQQARKREGSTIFDWLIEVLETHCPGGSEADDGVELILQ